MSASTSIIYVDLLVNRKDTTTLSTAIQNYHKTYWHYGTTQNVQYGLACFQYRSTVRRSGILWQIICLIRSLNSTVLSVT